MPRPAAPLAPRGGRHRQPHPGCTGNGLLRSRRGWERAQGRPQGQPQRSAAPRDRNMRPPSRGGLRSCPTHPTRPHQRWICRAPQPAPTRSRDPLPPSDGAGGARLLRGRPSRPAELLARRTHRPVSPRCISLLRSAARPASAGCSARRSAERFDRRAGLPSARGAPSESTHQQRAAERWECARVREGRGVAWDRPLAAAGEPRWPGPVSNGAAAATLRVTRPGLAPPPGGAAGPLRRLGFRSAPAGRPASPARRGVRAPVVRRGPRVGLNAAASPAPAWLPRCGASAVPRGRAAVVAKR